MVSYTGRCKDFRNRVGKREIKMKVLVVNTVGFGTNGITAVIMNLFQSINKENIQMDFVSINDSGFDFEQRIGAYGSKVYFLCRNNNPFLYMLKLAKLLKKGKYDVIHIHGNSATMAVETMAAALAGVKVRIAHSHSSSCTHMKIHKILYPFFCMSYTHGFACGEAAGKWLFRKDKFTVLNNAVDLGKYMFEEENRNKLRDELRLEDCFVIGHVGNFSPEKNHLFLLDVFAKVVENNSKTKLLLIGDGPLNEQIQEKIKGLGLEQHVILTGFVSNVDEYIQAMDAFVLPSVYEGFCVALLEAMASGLPCAVSDSIEQAAYFDECIDSFSIDNSLEWVDYLARMVEAHDSDNRGKISEERLILLEEKGFSLQKNAKVLEELYMSFLKK